MTCHFVVLVLSVLHHSLEISFQSCLGKQLSCAWFRGRRQFLKWMDYQAFMRAVERLKLNEN